MASLFGGHENSDDKSETLYPTDRPKIQLYEKNLPD